MLCVRRPVVVACNERQVRRVKPDNRNEWTAVFFLCFDKPNDLINDDPGIFTTKLTSGWLPGSVPVLCSPRHAIFRVLERQPPATNGGFVDNLRWHASGIGPPLVPGSNHRIVGRHS